MCLSLLLHIHLNYLSVTSLYFCFLLNLLKSPCLLIFGWNNPVMNPSFFKLPISFSPERLRDDCLHSQKASWISHFNTNDYVGDWTSISLRSASGAMDDIVSFANQTFKDTPLLAQCPYFQEVINWFQCEKEAIRLLRLAAKSEIKEHTDNDTSYDDGFFRIHIPIFTNARVLFYVDGHLLPMQPGECWYANFQLPHRVQNLSNEDRIHLVIDCKRNDWSDALFGAHGFSLTKPTDEETMSQETMLKVIEELTRNGSDTARILAENLRKNLK